MMLESLSDTSQLGGSLERSSTLPSLLLLFGSSPGACGRPLPHCIAGSSPRIRRDSVTSIQVALTGVVYVLLHLATMELPVLENKTGAFMELPVSENKTERKPEQRPASPPLQADDSNGFSLLTIIALLFLTVNSLDVAYRSRHDPPTLAFVVFAYSDLMVLLFCLKRMERLPLEGRERLKFPVWALSTALILAFSWRVAAVMPLVLAVVVWLMSGSVAVGGFYGLFIYREAEDNGVVDHAYSPPKSNGISPEDKV
ncbi:hypothetical protein OPV22_004267 [Ensete ventricosum]|uniref:Cationic amino acid transporter C-terminal domain-containing protein n=1 Tax=Ensete ventricosum TaxID=4639 RepID=A0AAV8S393_ENSVE|nr:hypothetical protein OPV22_004267 [Ensete ventricosum]